MKIKIQSDYIFGFNDNKDFFKKKNWIPAIYRQSIQTNWCDLTMLSS